MSMPISTRSAEAGASKKNTASQQATEAKAKAPRPGQGSTRNLAEQRVPIANARTAAPPPTPAPSALSQGCQDFLALDLSDLPADIAEGLKDLRDWLTYAGVSVRKNTPPPAARSSFAQTFSKIEALRKQNGPLSSGLTWAHKLLLVQAKAEWQQLSAVLRSAGIHTLPEPKVAGPRPTKFVQAKPITPKADPDKDRFVARDNLGDRQSDIDRMKQDLHALVSKPAPYSDKPTAPVRTRAESNLVEKKKAAAAPVKSVPGAEVPVLAQALREFSTLPRIGVKANPLVVDTLISLQESLLAGTDYTYQQVQQYKDAYKATWEELKRQENKLSPTLNLVRAYIKLLLDSPDAKALAGFLEKHGLNPEDPRHPLPTELSQMFAVLSDGAQSPSAVSHKPAPDIEEKQQSNLPQLMRDGFPFFANSIVQGYLKEHGPKGANAIRLKQVIVDDQGKIAALEIYKKGSNTKTKTLDVKPDSWKGTRLATYLSSHGSDVAKFMTKLQTQVSNSYETNAKNMRPFPSFSRKKERDLALSTLSEVMKALDRLERGKVKDRFLRQKPQSVPRVMLYDPVNSRALYDKGDLSKLKTLTGEALQDFIDDMVSLSFESMFKNRHGRFTAQEVEAFVTSFSRPGESLEDATSKEKGDRIYIAAEPDRAVLKKILADQDAKDFVIAVDKLIKKAHKTTGLEAHKDLRLTFTQFPFILGGMTSDEFVMEKIVQWQPSPSVIEDQLIRISGVYSECSKACVDHFMQDPQSYFPK